MVYWYYLAFLKMMNDLTDISQWCISTQISKLFHERSGEKRRDVYFIEVLTMFGTNVSNFYI